MEITVIDDSDYVGWLASATRTEEIYMTDVTSMVSNVLIAIGTNKISRLNILDHGNSRSLQIGSDRINSGNLSTFSARLSLLRGHFEPEGFVHLQHCDIGNNNSLLLALANIFGVSVYAGTGKHNPVYRFNFGDYVRCDAGGVCHTPVDRP